MTNPEITIVVKPLNRELIDTWQLLEKRRQALASIADGKNPRRSDAGVLRTIARH